MFLLPHHSILLVFVSRQGHLNFHCTLGNAPWSLEGHKNRPNTEDGWLLVQNYRILAVPCVKQKVWIGYFLTDCRLRLYCSTCPWGVFYILLSRGTQESQMLVRVIKLSSVADSFPREPPALGQPECTEPSCRDRISWGACSASEGIIDPLSDLENSLLQYMKSVIRVHCNFIFHICLLKGAWLFNKWNKQV